MRILAIETSCDETACAIVEDLPAGRQVELKILSSVVASSTEMHEKYGGIVPEIAAREQLGCIIPVIEEALTCLQQCNNVSMYQCINDSIDAIAVTVGPGLIGSLLVGVETAKTIAFVTGKPIIPVNHVLAHMYANFVRSGRNWKSQIPNPPAGEAGPNDQENSKTIQQFNNTTIRFPAISLVVSGGHTELYLMTSMKDLIWLGGTLDDAAGECFDKSARLLGFGNGGGVAIEHAASRHSGKRSCLAGERVQNPKKMLDKTSMTLPRPMIKDESLNFSFSGLKTAILREVNKLKEQQQFNNVTIQQLAYEVQEAITDVLVEKTIRAAQIHNAKSILLSGGVAANTRLRDKFFLAIQQFNNVTIHVPEVRLCTDNAVYIGSYAFFRGKPADWHKVAAIPGLSVENP